MVMAFSDVQRVAEQLHEAGVVDLDKPLREFLVSDSMAKLGGEGAAEAAGYVAVWEHYAVVCGISDMGRVVEELKSLRQ
jgi:hypothetical protein